MTSRNLPADAQNQLDAALCSLVAVRARLGLSQAEPPVEALDAALGADPEYQVARQKTRQALEALLRAAREHGLEALVLSLEEAANRQVAVALEVGWRLGASIPTGR